MKTKFLRIGLVNLVLTMTLFAIGPAQAVLADAPTKVPVSVTPPFVVSGYCTFDVLIENIKTPTLFAITFTDASGNFKLTVVHGDEPARLTNLSTGKSVTYNTAGTNRFYPDGSAEFTGPLFLGIDTTNAILLHLPPHPTILYTAGLSKFAADGQISFLSGHQIDMCDALSN